MTRFNCNPNFLSVIIDLGYKGKIHVTCYENDSKVIPVLSDSLVMAAAGIPSFEYKIIIDNFIISEPSDGFLQKEEVYDIVIGNPPYKKIPADSAEALHMKEVFCIAPNLYFLFMVMTVRFISMVASFSVQDNRNTFFFCYLAIIS